MTPKKYSRILMLIVTALTASIGPAQQASAQTNVDATLARPALKLPTADLTRRDALFMLDYQYIKLPNNEAIDLLGYHLLSPLNDWLYLGVGSYIPVTQGDYGGFMAFDVMLHAQRKVYGNLFVNGGLSFGGGGGGKSINQSVQLSGTGGFAKAYVGLGYDFDTFTVGANISRMKFFKSSIDGTQLNVFVQKPFSYRTGPYGKSGQKFTTAGSDYSVDGPETMISFGLDNYAQIDPTGSNKGTINVVDLQYSHFLNKHTYWYYALGVGYGGLPLYNQVIGGIGARIPISSRFNLYGQIGIGSGGYAPSVIDTGSGLLVYPKLAAEYKLNKNVGLALTAGYLIAPDGTSKNYTLGAALNYHIGAGNNGINSNQPIDGRYVGYRFSITHETKLNLTANGASQPDLNLIAIQADRIINSNLYVPIRASIAYESYRGYPGYGEFLVGLGVQSKYSTANRFQFFGEVQVGANVEGTIMRGGVGMNYGLNEDYALRGMVSQTVGANGFNSTNVELGLTYQFSLPSF